MTPTPYAEGAVSQLELLVAGIALVALMFGASVTAHRTARWREHRRRQREWRQALRYLHSGHIDALPRTGGPPDTTDPK